MKTDHDLLEELMRRLFAASGAPPREIEAQMLQWRLDRQKFRMKPPTPLTDAEYEARLAAMTQELPAFAHDLLNLPVGELPKKFLGGNN